MNNSKGAIIEWAWNALVESDTTPYEIEILYQTATKMAKAGYLRGDISQTWRELGFGPEKIHDFYP